MKNLILILYSIFNLFVGGAIGIIAFIPRMILRLFGLKTNIFPFLEKYFTLDYFNLISNEAFAKVLFIGLIIIGFVGFGLFINYIVF